MFAAAPIAPPALAGSAEGDRYAVATVHPLATDAAMAVFAEGGNAVDAAIAAALTLGVVDNHNSGIGGGCLILLRKPDGELLAIDGRETAPAGVSRDMFVVDGKPDVEASQTGPLAVGVPGALAAYQRALELVGSLPLARLLAPGEHYAREGFPIDSVYASALAETADELNRFPASRAALLRPDGGPYREGEILVQADLAETYRRLAERGIDWFYRGPFAQRTGEWMQANGGVLRASDFAAYEAKLREPIESTYRGYRIVGFPPPSSGGVHVAEILNILEPYDLGSLLKSDAPAGYHLIAEAMKLAFADRAYWLGDADFVDVPRGLLDKEYAARLAERIDLTKVVSVKTHGAPPRWNQDHFGRHTTHIAAADRDGNWAAITATVNTTFGSKVVIPGSGVVLNNEMDDFSIQPGVGNAFGLVGGASNAVEPGKRPLSSMSPTIVLGESDEPVLTVGAAGGPRIITSVLLTLVHCLDEGMTLDEAIAAPRMHHQWRPDRLRIEATAPDELVDAFYRVGHDVRRSDFLAVAQGIAVAPGGGFEAVSDPRAPGKASAE